MKRRSGVRSRLDAILGVLSGGRWSSVGGGSVSEMHKRDLSTGRRSLETRRRRSTSRSSERKGEVDDEPATLRRSISGYFTASEDFSETDDETPKADRSESKLLKSSMRCRSPSAAARRCIEFQTAEKSLDRRQSVKTTPTNTEKGEGSKKQRRKKQKDRTQRPFQK